LKKFCFKILFILLSILTFNKSFADYNFNNNCKKAYSYSINLDFINAKQIIITEKNNYPENLIPYYLDNIIDFLSIICSENPDLFYTLKSNKQKRIELLEKGNTQSPYYRYCLAEVYLQWATARIIFDEYLTAAYEINKAYKLLKKNNELFPYFTPNLKSLGILHALIGSIPDDYKWIMSIIGFEGTIEQGVNQLAIVLKSSLINDSYKHLSAETLFYLAYVSLNLNNDRDDVINIIKFVESDKTINDFVKTSALVNFCVANMYLRTKYNSDKAIQILSDFNPCKNCFSFTYRYYANGLARLNRLDKNADAYFNIFLTENNGLNFIKSCYQKLAWHCLINNDTLGYYKNMGKVKTMGNNKSEDDIQALAEAESNEIPNIILLKARLLFDGGYYKRAIDVLNTFDIKKPNTSNKDILEYTYRRARIYHEYGDTTQAVFYYLKTIELGETDISYYAANACLNLGFIYEVQNNKDLAISYFKKAMSLNNTEYKYSINQKAKAGLNRIK